jgi:hypothetical protein
LQLNERIHVDLRVQAVFQSSVVFFRFQECHELELLFLIAGDQIHGAACVGIFVGDNAAMQTEMHDWEECGFLYEMNSHFLFARLFLLYDVAIAVVSFPVPAWSQVHFAILQRVLARSDLLFSLSIGDGPEQ